MSDDQSPKTDLVVPLAEMNDRGEIPVVRTDGETLTFGTIGILKDGAPMPKDAEVLGLQEIPGAGVYQVTSSTGGPPKVNSRAYRDGWDNIFGTKKQSLSDLPN
jgi:hypothetical protein